MVERPPLRAVAWTLGRSAWVVGVLALLVLGFAAPAGAKGKKKKGPTVRFSVMNGYPAPGTPDNLNRVGVLKTGDPKAPNVLVLNPGTSAGSGYFEPLAKTVVKELPDWQVWSVERRENFLEDQSEENLYKQGRATSQDLFDYYLGFQSDKSVTRHVQNVPDSAVPFARDWGMNVEIQDLRLVTKQAARKGRNVVMGGHSLGGSIATAYTTWDFNGRPGGRDLSGLVLIDGASSPTPVTADAATTSLQKLQTSSPWLAIGGIPAPLLGQFGMVGSSLAQLDAGSRSPFSTWPLTPSFLKPVNGDALNNEAAFGFATNVGTSPASLALAQVHAGQLGPGDPRTWDSTGALSPIQRWSQLFSGWGVQNLDGMAWYHPSRLSLDSGAVGDGVANPAQSVLDVHSTMAGSLRKSMRIYAFGAALGGDRVLTSAQSLAGFARIPARHLTLVNRQSTYAHNDPNAAAPKINDFLKYLVKFLNKDANQVAKHGK